jgi:predicted phage gp36 major capsid-like protein
MSFVFQRLTNFIHHKEAELSELRSRMREMEEELSRAKQAAHMARMDNQQVLARVYSWY